MNSARFYEEDFSGFLQQLVDSKQLEPMQEGITKLVIDKGMTFYPKSKEKFSIT